MSKQTIQRYQTRVYMNARDAGLTQANAAEIAEISERTGQRIESGRHRPNRGRPRDWRTKPDPLSAVWSSELEPMLHREPRLKPTTLYEYLQEQYPGQYSQVLRTLQRRVRAWKAVHGPAPEVMFELRHEPGMMGLSDFTELKGVEITINGKPFEHLIYHYRLAYSGWQYAQVIQGGESFIALSEGLQNALHASGGAPQQHRTDSLSAAYRNARGQHRRQLTQLYDELCDHYRLEPTRNNKGIAHENGGIEAPHGHLKNRLTQAIYLRERCDFDSLEAYQQFIQDSVDKLNERCQTKFAEEQKYLQPLPKYRACDYEVLSARVSRYSTIDVRCVLYSVPSRLMGRQLELHLYHDRLMGYLGQQLMVELPRVRVSAEGKRRARCINYRHVIEGLKAKPRAFLYCTWQDDLLPNDHYRRLWAQLKDRFERDSAAVLMVEALYIAATQNKAPEVADYLESQLTDGTLTLLGLRRHFQLLTGTSLPPVTVKQHDLSSYDQLLNPSQLLEPIEPIEPIVTPTELIDDSQSTDLSKPLPETQSPPQKLAPFSHAQSLGNPGTSGHAGTVVLRPVLARTLSIRGQQTMASPPQTRPQGSSIPWHKDLSQFRLDPFATAQSRAADATGG